MRARALVLVLAGLLGLAGPAHATDALPQWTVVPEASQIRFEYLIDGKTREGVFERFSGQGRFDAAAPDAAQLELAIESRSIDLGNLLVSAYATSAEWFDSKNHPVVAYRLLALEPLGGARFEAVGEITLLGRTERLVSPMRLVTGTEGARAQGTLSLDRTAFGLGVGLSDILVEIGAEVSVHFDLAARRGG
ncbi:MAG: YceI family protein [Pseudomonadota bacterium]